MGNSIDILDVSDVDLRIWFSVSLLRDFTEILTEVPEDMMNPEEILGTLRSHAAKDEDDSLIKSLETEIEELVAKSENFWKKELERENKRTKEERDLCIKSCIDRRIGREITRAMMTNLRINKPSAITNMLIERAITEIDRRGEECRPQPKLFLMDWAQVRDSRIAELKRRISIEKERIAALKRKRQERAEQYETLLRDIDKVILGK